MKASIGSDFNMFTFECLIICHDFGFHLIYFPFKYQHEFRDSLSMPLGPACCRKSAINMYTYQIALNKLNYYIPFKSWTFVDAHGCTVILAIHSIRTQTFCNRYYLLMSGLSNMNWSARLVSAWHILINGEPV